MRPPTPLIDRFTQKIDEPFDVHNDCWEWKGAKYKGGYGFMRIGSTSEGAHRISHKLFVGPIPDGYTVDHMCRNRGCVRPDHLRLLPYLEHQGQGQRDKTHCTNGHEFSEENTYRYRNERHCKACRRINDRKRRNYGK